MNRQAHFARHVLESLAFLRSSSYKIHHEQAASGSSSTPLECKTRRLAVRDNEPFKVSQRGARPIVSQPSPVCRCRTGKSAQFSTPLFHFHQLSLSRSLSQPAGEKFGAIGECARAQDIEQQAPAQRLACMAGLRCNGNHLTRALQESGARWARPPPPPTKQAKECQQGTRCRGGLRSTCGYIPHWVRDPCAR